MTRKSATTPVKLAFEPETACISVEDIQPLKIVTAAIKKTVKYAKIVASIREIGIVEPPAVSPDRSAKGKYLLLDGHLRLEAWKELGKSEITCLVATEDEAFTYNKRINRLAMVQEHNMIMKAIEKGVPEERIAAALNIDITTLRQKKIMLTGICREAVQLLQDKHVPATTFWSLKKMSPMRQIEAAELMIAMNRYTITYARSLLAATPPEQLANSSAPKGIKGLTPEQMSLMERESGNLEQAFKLAEQSYGSDHLHLVLAKGYLGRLVSNTRITRYLAQNHSEILAEFRKLADIDSAAA
jgi:hypothetical protein